MSPFQSRIVCASTAISSYVCVVYLQEAQELLYRNEEVADMTLICPSFLNKKLQISPIQSLIFPKGRNLNWFYSGLRTKTTTRSNNNTKN